ncbi:hypothetical protein [Novosphingobium soli]|uniref:DUF2892 domain-containing protein n=1 Tax=Novosphingobium soli TaxID=574956 RepID=A0ABV6CUA1_9SPHN
MTDRDPAVARFATINAVRIAGVAFVIVGMLMASDRLLAGAPAWVAYLLIANGLVDVFVIPPMLVRKWRTPR